MARPRPLSADARDWLRQSVEQSSVSQVAQRLQVADGTLIRAIAGLDIFVGTATLLEVAYEKREAA